MRPANSWWISNSSIKSIRWRNGKGTLRTQKAQDDLLASDAGLKELDARLAESTRRLRTMSTRQTTQNRAGPNLQSVQQLTAVIIDLENKRTALLTNYKPEDRMVRELDQQIAATRAALNDAASTKPVEVTTDVDPAWQQVRTDYAQGNISRRAAAARQAAWQLIGHAEAGPGDDAGPQCPVQQPGSAGQRAAANLRVVHPKARRISDRRRHG